MPARLSPQDERLRAKLVQVIAAGQHPKYTPENLWAAQGQQQLPKPPSNVEDYPVAPGVSVRGLTSPIQQLQDPDPQFAFPMATAGPRAPEPDEPPKKKPEKAKR
jgi:hypothetical protein